MSKRKIEYFVENNTDRPLIQTFKPYNCQIVPTFFLVNYECSVKRST